VRLTQTAVVTVSAAFHLLLFLVAFSRASGDLMSGGEAGGGPAGPVMAVSLVRLQASPGPSGVEAASLPSPLRVKLNRTATEGRPFAEATEASRLEAWAERLAIAPGGSRRETRHPADREQLSGTSAPSDAPLNDARNRRPLSEAAADGDASGGVSTGALWGAMEPCWRNLGFRGQVPVTIEVELDAGGGLRRPPTVVRTPTARLSEPRLRSEANALAALTACLPRDEVRFAARRHLLSFPGSQ
jgi:hypothetical protein